MNKNSLTTAVIAGLAGVAGIANMASAVNLNPDGLGQVLLYPYYTVNGGQNTLLSVVNTTNVGKAVKVRFLEGYDSREVLDFNLFLSPFDVWTAGLFSLGGDTSAAAITTTDNSCTAPQFKQGTLSNGAGYQSFLNYAYAGTNYDTGPTDVSRTREGHFEMITMSDILPNTDLSDDTTHVNSVPPGCAIAQGTGSKTQAEFDFEAGGETTTPTSGIFGSAAVVNVAQGTYYPFNADAIDGFTSVTLDFPTGSLDPSLRNVNDAGGATATSYVFDDGALLTSVYPTTGGRPIDAVSSIFMASNVYNEYEADASAISGTDWVVNFPTKRFYVDTLYAALPPIAPFEEEFEDSPSGDGLSCTRIAITIYDREENTSQPAGCGFSPCPPGQPDSSLCHETNVITFNQSGTNSILSSGLSSNIQPIGTTGWVGLDLTQTSGTNNAHDLRASTNGNVFTGLPITGFEAVNFVTGNSSGSILSNYSGAYRHRISRLCANGGAGGACS